MLIDWSLLLAALISVESGGDRLAVGDGGKAVGCLQIHKICVDDVNRINKLKTSRNAIPYIYTYKDRKSESTSRAMAIAYMRFYGEQYKKRSGYDPTYEIYARAWNGGPKGMFKDATIPYWRKVKASMDEIRVNQ